MNKLSIYIFTLFAVFFVGCGTYYDPTDPYTIGLRFWDRGDIPAALKQWDPLVKAGDPDAEYHVGWYLLAFANGKGPEGMALLEKAGRQGQPKALAILGDIYYQSTSNVLFKASHVPFPRNLKLAYSYYLRAQKCAVYSGESSALTIVIKSIESEMLGADLESVRTEVEPWNPTIIGRAPRKLL